MNTKKNNFLRWLKLRFPAKSLGKSHLHWLKLRFPAQALRKIREFSNQSRISFKSLSLYLLIALSGGLAFGAIPPEDNMSRGINKVIENIDYIYMSMGLEMDYPLPKSFKKQKLTFSGNYKKYSSALYRKASNDIRFKPKRIGSAVLIIKNKKDQIIGRLHIDIQKDNLHKIAAELRDALVTVDGIKVKIYNKKVIVDGQVLWPRDMARVKTVLKQYKAKGLVQSIVTYSPEAQNRIAENIEKEIGYPELTVRSAYNRFMLEGCVNDQNEVKRALSIANLHTQFDLSSVGDEAKKRTTGIHLVKNELTYPCESVKKKKEESKQKEEIKKLIQIVVHFVEMNKSFSKGFAFQWTPAIADGGTSITASAGGAPGASRGISAVLTATVANFFPKLKWAKDFGFARVLHNSSLLVEDGTTGTINTRTSVPTKTLENGTQVSGGASAEVQTVVKPEIKGERGNLIKMQINVSVASPAPDGTTSRSISTTISVRDRSSAVVGGLMSSFLNRSYNKDPEKVENPLLNLISSKEYNTKKTQFVVFITPLIKSSASVGVERIKRKFKLDE